MLKKLILPLILATNSLISVDWHPSHFVWTYGFPQLVDVSLNPAPYLRDTPFQKELLNDIKPGSTIWISLYQFGDFHDNIFPQIEHPFILILGGSVFSFPDQFEKTRDINKFMKDPRVIHVFSQNTSIPHSFPNLSPLPLGMNFDVQLLYPEKYCTEFSTIDEQEANLCTIIKDSLPTNQRIPLILDDFHLYDTLKHSKHPGTRHAISQTLQGSGVSVKLPRRIAREELWKKKSQYAFSVSPHGYGLDCHRTWEDLVLGCIVIVKTSPLDCLYDNLPVVIVDDWSEITQEKLDGWLEEFGDTLSNPDYRMRLTQDYWMDKIKKMQVEFLTKRT